MRPWINVNVAKLREAYKGGGMRAHVIGALCLSPPLACILGISHLYFTCILPVSIHCQAAEGIHRGENGCAIM